MSDIEDHLQASPGYVIDQYKVIRKLGTGTFGRVFLCQKHVPQATAASKKFKKHNKHLSRYDKSVRDQRDEEALQEAESQMVHNLVAVKVIRPVAKYIKEAQDEVNVMRQLDSPYIPKCVEAKPWRDRFLVVTPAFGPNLYDIIQKRQFRPMSTRLSILYIEQTLKALAHMHEQKVAHTDIKPENILVQSVDHVKRGIQLIDMGGAVPLEELNTSTIQTRQYRAPEVVLGLPWSELVDIWSVGCTLAELVSGSVLFPAHDNRAHLAMIERCIGPFPDHMVVGSSHFSLGAVKFPSMGMSEQTISDVCSVAPLKQQFKQSLPVYALLRRMLATDPADRYSAKELVDKIARWRAKGKL